MAPNYRRTGVNDTRMDAFLNLLSEYGTAVYAVLFAYCAFKSGILPLFAGYAAQTGALDVGIVAAVTFAGGYLGDEARFAVARRYGEHVAHGRPRLSNLLDKSRALLDRYGGAYIFLYRYPKGLRTVGALPVGLTDMVWSRFSLLNASSALVWTAILVGAGYAFGTAIRQKAESGWGIASVVLLLIFIGATWFAWSRLSRRYDTAGGR